MKRQFEKIFAFVCACVMMLSFAGCDNGSQDSGGSDKAPQLLSNTDTTIENMDRNNAFGFCELPAEFTGSGATEPETTIDFVVKTCEAFEAKSIRVWMHMNTIFTRSETSDELSFNEDMAELYHQYFTKLKEAGVTQILVMNHQFIKPYDYYDQSGQCMPDPWNGEYDFYVRTLAIYENAYRMLQEEFPEITYWEPGNELDAVQFLHKSDWTSGNDRVFTDYQLAYIAADLCWYANRGVKAVNADSVVVAPGFTGGTKLSEMVNVFYDIIVNEKCVPTAEEFYDPNPDHYFQIMAWHPYTTSSDRIDPVTGESDWHYDVDDIMTRSDAVYEVMKEYGDSDKKVWYTECGIANSKYPNGEPLDEIYQYYLEEMFAREYVETAFFFRITNLWNFEENELESSHGVMYAQADPVNHGKPKPQAEVLYRFFKYDPNADTSPIWWYYNSYMGL